MRSRNIHNGSRSGRSLSSIQVPDYLQIETGPALIHHRRTTTSNNEENGHIQIQNPPSIIHHAPSSWYHPLIPPSIIDDDSEKDHPHLPPASIVSPLPLTSITLPTQRPKKPIYHRLQKKWKFGKQRLASILESAKLHYVVFTLVGLDLLFTFIEILITLLDEECLHKRIHPDNFASGTFTTRVDPHPVTFLPTATSECSHETTLTVLRWLSTSVLCLFAVEILLRLVCFGWRYYWRSKLHMFDASVVIISLVLQLSLEGISQEIAGLLIFLRFWRVIRLVDNAVFVAVLHSEQEFEGKKSVMEKRIDELTKELYCEKKEVERLKMELDESEFCKNCGYRNSRCNQNKK